MEVEDFEVISFKDAPDDFAGDMFDKVAVETSAVSVISALSEISKIKRPRLLVNLSLRALVLLGFVGVRGDSLMKSFPFNVCTSN